MKDQLNIEITAMKELMTSPNIVKFKDFFTEDK
jgi:hypothetical protein